MKTLEFFKKEPVKIFIITALIMLTGVIGTEITHMDVRFALMVEDINMHGLGLFSTINGKPYLDYFSSWMLFSWLTSLCGHAVTLTGLTLPSILLGAYTCMMVYLTGERVGKGIGIGAVMLLLITPEFSTLFIGLGIDVPVMAVGITMLYLLQREDVSKIKFYGIFSLLLLGAFLIRGPLGVILPCAGVCGSLLAARKWKGFTAAGFTGAAILIIGMAICIGLIFLTGGRKLWNWFVESQFLERVSHGKRSPTMLLDLYFSLAPVALISLGIFLHSRRRIFSQPAAGWIGFVALPLILMLLPSRVHVRYLAILQPCWALLGAYAFSCGRFGSWFQNVIYRRLKQPLDRWYRPVCCLVVLILAVIGICLNGMASQPWWHYLATVLLVSTIPFWTEKSWTPVRPLLALGIVFFAALNPFLAVRERAKDFTAAVESARTGRLWLLEMGVDHDELKYILHMTPKERYTARYIFFNPPKLTGMYKEIYHVESIHKVFSEIKESDVIVLPDDKSDIGRLRELAEKHHCRVVVVKTGKIGHDDIVAVRLQPF